MAMRVVIGATGDFYYNRTVNNITDVHVTNVYTKTVVNDVTVNRVSYVGGTGGMVARPSSQEEKVARQPHTPPTAVQTQHREAAGVRRDLLASVNQGKPAIAGTAKPNEFSSHVVSATRAGGPVPAAITKPAGAPPPAVRTAPARSKTPAPAPPTSGPAHVRDLPKNAPIAAPPATATAEEKSTRASRTTLQATQNHERKALAQQQQRDHANFARSPGNADQQAAMERQHRQQTQQMQQRHTTEQKNIAKPAPHQPSPHEPSPKEPSSHETPR